MAGSRIQNLGVALVIALSLTGCSLIGGVMKMAFWTGVILVAVVFMIIWWFMKRARAPRYRDRTDDGFSDE